MTGVETTREILTPEQVAAYLQINKETVYRYIREGKLVASRLGRAYRVPKFGVELLLYATRTRSDIPLRRYSATQIEEFLQEDRLGKEAARIARRFAKAHDLPEPKAG